LQGNGHGAADAARDHHRFIFVNEARGSLHSRVGLCFGIDDAVFNRFAQNPLFGQRRDFLDLLGAGI
jgi:hypothetical protein